MAFATIQPFQYVALRLPSENVKVEQIIPNAHINLGKYGSFRTNQIIGRPYNLTFEILDRSEVEGAKELRIVPAAELHAVALVEQAETEDASTPRADVDDTGAESTPKSNVNTHDDPTNQKLTMAEIEALKQDDLGSGKAIIQKIMQSHSTLDQKTAFSLAKYTLRKHRKYLKRFCVMPLDVHTFVDWMMTDREFTKIMEMRNEALALVGCWANIHASSHDSLPSQNTPSSRYLAVDDTGGLIVAAMAERMGLLHQRNLGEDAAQTGEEDEDEQSEQAEALLPHKDRREQYRPSAMSATSNSITLVHANQQPNLGILRYFNYDQSLPTPSHPLYSSLRTLSWLQLLEPESDITYQEPEVISPSELAKMKSNRRSAYYRKRRRWERVKTVVDETRDGGFTGLIVASYTDPVSILRHLVPLLAGGSQVVVYSPNIEPLVRLADLYSTARRTAFLKAPEEERRVPSDDFPLDPTLLLAPTVQTARVRQWQVLPGRTHPLMTSKGGAEGYIFTGIRVLPAEGKVAARGNRTRVKKSKAEESEKGAVTGNDDESSETPLKKQKTETGEAVLAQQVPTPEPLKGEPDLEAMQVDQNGGS